MIINLKLRELRIENELNQRNLAEFLNVTQHTYSRYETGELRPSIDVMERLSEFYKTSVDYLMGLTDIREPYKRKIQRFNSLL